MDASNIRKFTRQLLSVAFVNQYTRTIAQLDKTNRSRNNCSLTQLQLLVATDFYWQGNTKAVIVHSCDACKIAILQEIKNHHLKQKTLVMG